MVLPEQLLITILLVGVVLFLGVAVFKVSAHTFHVVQENRRLELEITRLELTYRSLVDESKQLMTHFEIHAPSE